MDQIESQIAKIQLGSPKKTNNYAYCLAEKAMGSQAELYAICELPLLNPAAEDSCKQICASITGSLKRTYKKSLTPSSFENAISEINEELGKLVALGQTDWVDKLNAIIAVKEGSNLHISTTGKVSAFLFRNSEFTDISSSSSHSHPLKTFENFATGKIRLNDIVILSTTQLFNHLAVDRLKEILQASEFLRATQNIIAILKSNAGPEVAFGTILIQQCLAQEVKDEEIDLENYIQEPAKTENSLKNKVLVFLKALLAFSKKPRQPQTSLPHTNFGDRLRHFGGSTKKALSSGQSLIGRAFFSSRRNITLSSIKEYSPQKKILLASVFILLIALGANIYLAVRNKTVKVSQNSTASQLKDIGQLLNNTETLLLYKDEKGARESLQQAVSKLPKSDAGMSADNKQTLQKLNAQLKDLQTRVEKVSALNVTNLGNIGSDSKLIKLGGYLATQVGSSMVSYNTDNKTMQDGVLMSSESIVDAAYIKDTQAIVYNGSALLKWDFGSKQYNAAFSQNVPDKANFGGMKYYSTNNRVYLANKKTGQITSFLVGNTLSKPVAAVKDSSVEKALDLSVDGNVYVLSQDGLHKFLAGRPVDFSLPFLITPFSGSGKVMTLKDWKNIYILDSGNNRVIVTDKRGNLVATYKNEAFTNLKDFFVSEADKTIYLLNDSSLLKAVMP